MSYQTNNHEVATVLYYKNNRYSILDAFGSYAKLTTDQYRSLPEVARQNRVEAFYLKLSSELGIENIGSLVLQGSEDRQLNLNGCPIDDYYLFCLLHCQHSKYDRLLYMIIIIHLPM